MLDNINLKKLAVRVVVTFVEAAIPFLALNHWDYTNRVVIAGAVGAGLSVVWNTVFYPQVKEYLERN